MSYFDGFVIPVPSGNKEAYRRVAAEMAPIFIELGALRVGRFELQHPFAGAVAAGLHGVLRLLDDACLIHS